MGTAEGVESPIGIERFGAIQADLAAGVPREDALTSARVTDAELALATDHWLGAMALEVRRGRTALAQRYARAFVARRPELLDDPDPDVDLLAPLPSRPPPPHAGSAPPRSSEPSALPPASRLVPSYLLQEAVLQEALPQEPVGLPPGDGHTTLPPFSREESVVPFAPGPPTPPPPRSEPPSATAQLPPTPRKSSISGTMMALEIPASFKAVPFSKEPSAPPSPAARVPSSAPPSPLPTPSTMRAPSGPSRPAITGTAAFELPAHLRNLPLSSTPAPPAPPAPSASAPAPATARALPTLEEYVRLGVELGATPPERVDVVLAQAQWTRAAWVTVDQTYRARLAREPALRAAFDAALANERARRAGARR